jgi:murein DD-endopeptidase MepM/ murein hydrolase activator NlpD
MKVILVSQKFGSTKTLNLSRQRMLLLALAGALLLAALTSATYFLAKAQVGPTLSREVLAQWKSELDGQAMLLAEEKRAARESLDAMAVRMAEYQARMLRLEALGERLTVMAKLDSGEFDFSEKPAMGGPEEEAISGGDVYSKPDFIDSMDRLSSLIESREQQLDILETLITNRQIEDAGYLAGRPIKKGWMSSGFGKRTDPFNGQLAWHKGVDFAGKENAEIIAVASGVVTWSGERYGYGEMVEVNHGNGFSTRYAHNKENLVTPGEIVKKGQVIAKMGSSGRSTGPHVHFEVYKDGKAVNPARYIHRASR